MARVMYIDCFSGAAGDMVLGALVDAGVPLAAVREALGSLGLGHELAAERVVRAGVSATHITVRPKGQPAATGAAAAHGSHEAAGHTYGHSHPPSHTHAHGPETGYGHSHGHAHDHGPTHGHDHHHAHAHGEDGHRTLDEIVHLIGHSALSAAGKDRASAMMRRLGEAEAAIHAIPLSDVHLHEVGAVDSIIDVVGTVFALEWLGIDDIVASPLNVGGGTIQIAHGTYPVPAPATLRLLAGVPMYGSDLKAELVTPTGALIVSTYARQFGPVPPMTVERMGYGAGTRDFADRPNVLRVVIGERAAAPAGRDEVIKIECELDDMSPQLFGPASEALFAAGALDVYVTPIQMKKGRPGSLLTVLGRPADRSALTEVVFRETTTLGVRVETVTREILDRSWEEVDVPGGRVRIKIATRDGHILNVAPEFEDCASVARTTGRPVKVVQAEALRAWQATRGQGSV